MILCVFLFLLGSVGFGNGGAIGEMSSPQYDTIVVGLGSAGTTAATELARAGRRVLALEAQDRVGGRVKTVPIAGGIVEEGAEWIHGQKPSPVYDAAIANNVSLLSQDLDLEVFNADGSTMDRKMMNDILKYVLVALEDVPQRSETLGKYLTAKIKDYLKEKYPTVLDDKDVLDALLEFVNLLMNNYEASNDWNDVSAWSKYEDLEGDLHTSWHKHGYHTFFEILLNTYKNGPGLPTLEKKLNTEVIKIEWPENPEQNVRVTCANGDVFTAKTAVVTVSLGVLKERYQTLFSPVLPQEKVDAIKEMSFGVLNKVIIEFPSQWWAGEPYWYYFFWHKQDVRTLADDEKWFDKVGGPSFSMGNDRTLSLWLSGDAGKLIETLPEEVVKTKCMKLLRMFMGKKYDIPDPSGIIISKWYSNPYTRGSYSYDNVLTPTHPGLRETLGKPLVDKSNKPRVVFAGEAVNPRHFSTVHGASEMGKIAAKVLLTKDAEGH